MQAPPPCFPPTRSPFTCPLLRLLPPLPSGSQSCHTTIACPHTQAVVNCLLNTVSHLERASSFMLLWPSCPLFFHRQTPYHAAQPFPAPTPQAVVNCLLNTVGHLEGASSFVAPLPPSPPLRHPTGGGAGAGALALPDIQTGGTGVSNTSLNGAGASPAAVAAAGAAVAAGVAAGTGAGGTTASVSKHRRGPSRSALPDMDIAVLVQVRGGEGVCGGGGGGEGGG